jgi:hypothetical protein
VFFKAENYQYKNENVLKSVTIAGSVCKHLWRLKGGNLAVGDAWILPRILPYQIPEMPVSHRSYEYAIAFPIRPITKDSESDFLY